MINILLQLIGMSTGGTPPVGNWILRTNFWDDSGVWIDSDFWND